MGSLKLASMALLIKDKKGRGGKGQGLSHVETFRDIILSFFKAAGHLTQNSLKKQNKTKQKSSDI